MANVLEFNPGWIKDPWVELTALLGDDEREKLVPIILQLGRDVVVAQQAVLQAQLKAIDAAKAAVGANR